MCLCCVYCPYHMYCTYTHIIQVLKRTQQKCHWTISFLMLAALIFSFSLGSISRYFKHIWNYNTHQFLAKFNYRWYEDGREKKTEEKSDECARNRLKWTEKKYEKEGPERKYWTKETKGYTFWEWQTYTFITILGNLMIFHFFFLIFHSGASFKIPNPMRKTLCIEYWT